MQSLLANARSRMADRPKAPSPMGQANIIIIGCGGAGNNTVDRLMKVGIKGAQTIAINTDQVHLDVVKANKKLLIGRNTTRGLGAGGVPEVGREAAEESRHELDMILKGADLVFITCGEGGGTGTGSAPVVAEIAKLNGALTVGVVTMPFKIEKGRMNRAKDGLNALREFVDTLVVIDNNRLMEIAPDLPIEEAFSVADEVLATMVKGITETVSMPSLINLDIADIKTILSTGGVAIVGIGESNAPGIRVEEAIQNALQSPLLEVDITGATGALIHVTGGRDMTLEEANRVGEKITESMDPDALVIWGARVDPSPHFAGYLRVMLLITGIKSQQIMGPTG
ncbi:MAG TPA: cell division protein FtsZ, partial [Candidatus Lokiarchaeia archaeon]|nr:cell division protein FtsZ [Candidatus Lokiarchaeia archaeon]